MKAGAKGGGDVIPGLHVQSGKNSCLSQLKDPSLSGKPINASASLSTPLWAWWTGDSVDSGRNRPRQGRVARAIHEHSVRCSRTLHTFLPTGRSIFS
jgi:hypothetical protein